MKTIQPGQVKPKNLEWWVGKRVKCACGFVGEIEAGDEKKPGVSIIAARCIKGPRTITVPCPTCGGVARYDSPANPR